MTKIPFIKVESLKNDFVIVEDTGRGKRWSAKRAAAICDRRLGVGADGLILLGPASSAGIRFRLHNSDGSSAEWSGNGVRGTGAYLAAEYPRRSEFHLLTTTGCIRVEALRSKRGGVVASFTRPLPPMSLPSARDSRDALAAAGRVVTAGPVFVDAGNPHWVFVVSSFDFDWENVGAMCQSAHPRTRGINVEFVRVLTSRRIEFRIYERGVGPTPSSGSGALAAVTACYAMNLIGQSVSVSSPGGVQSARIDGKAESISLSALARIVMAGVWSDGLATAGAKR